MFLKETHPVKRFSVEKLKLLTACSLSAPAKKIVFREFIWRDATKTALRPLSNKQIWIWIAQFQAVSSNHYKQLIRNATLKNYHPIYVIGLFRLPPRLCFKTRVGAQPLIMEIIFHSQANKTHFHKKGCAPGLVLKVRVFGTRKWPMLRSSVPAWNIEKQKKG